MRAGPCSITTGVQPSAPRSWCVQTPFSLLLSALESRDRRRTRDRAGNCCDQRTGPWYSTRRQAFALIRATEAEIIENRIAVGLGPHADCARAWDAVVHGVDVDLAVERDFDRGPPEFHTQRVPRVLRHGGFDVPDGVTAAIRRVVKGH